MKNLPRLLVVLLILLIPNTSTGSATPSAATITVNTTIDEMTTNSACSLREAIYGVNNGIYTYGCTLSGSGAVTINLPVGEFFLDHTGANEDPGLTGDLDILTSLTIIGDGPYDTFIDGKDSDRVFDILAGYSATVTISELTVRHGNSGSGDGGGIRNNANLILDHVYVDSNHTDSNGGGIYHKHGAAPLSPPLVSESVHRTDKVILANAVLTLNNSTVIGNTAKYHGGGIMNAEDSRMVIQVSTIMNNTSDSDLNDIGNGGGVYNISAQPFRMYSSKVLNNSTGHGNGGGLYTGPSAGICDVIVTDSLFNNNSASAQGGGGIFHACTQGTMVLSRSTLEYNTADWGGGLVTNGGKMLQIENVTFSQNTATNFLKGGGAIYIASGTLVIVHATIAENTAEEGAGIYNAGGGLGVFIEGTIIADNKHWGWLVNCYGVITTLGFNLSDGSDCSLSAGELFNTDPRLGSYGLHHTSNPNLPTYSLLLDSPAIDAAEPTSSLLLDERSLPRPVDGNGDGLSVNDIGAYEAQLMLFLPMVVK